MFSISDPLNPEELSRRRFMQIGALSSLGLSLPQMLHAKSAPWSAGIATKAKSCIMIFCNGGPAHLDTFDPKPDAPSEIKGPWDPIRTSVRGMHINEKLPKLAKCAQDFSLIRSVSHTDGLHPSATYWALTGHKPGRSSLQFTPQPTHMPSVGSVLSRFRPAQKDLPSYVLAPQLCYDVGNTQPGQHAGLLGGSYDPFIVEGEPEKQNFRVRGLSLSEGLSNKRFRGRLALRQKIEQRLDHLGESLAGQALDTYHEQAYNLLSSTAAKRAFDLNLESDQLRDRYGRNRFGQSYLLARRLIEAGVRMVFISDNVGSGNDRWDTHGDNYGTLKKNLPETDAALSSLLMDLRDRNLLDETLVVWMGEMGRSPKNDHRDHWPQCYSVLMAGGGIQGGQVYGESDRIGAYPKNNACTPGDVLATVYTAMGIPSDTTIDDLQGRPVHLFAGKPIREMF